jgi:hypothetical protein
MTFQVRTANYLPPWWRIQFLWNIETYLLNYTPHLQGERWSLRPTILYLALWPSEGPFSCLLFPSESHLLTLQCSVWPHSLHPIYILQAVSHPAHFNPEDGHSMPRRPYSDQLLPGKLHNIFFSVALQPNFWPWPLPWNFQFHFSD